MATERTLAAASDCSGQCETPSRNRYFRGKLLTAADYRDEQTYHIRRRRLVTRAVLGWGVASGFGVTLDNGPPARLVVTPGVAFDHHGREVVVCDRVELEPRDLLWLTVNGEAPPTLTAEPKRYLLCAHYAEAPTDPVSVRDACREESRQRNRVCETVVFSLRPDCPEASGEPKPFPCLDGEEVAPWYDRGPHHALCARPAPTPDIAPCDPGKLDRIDGLQVDLDAGVPIACVQVAKTVTDGCPSLTFQSVEETCKSKRLIRTNDMLFDLIRGADLTRITSISWAEWHYADEAMPWETFKDFVRPGDTKIGFNVSFSRGIQVKYITPYAASMLVLSPSEDHGYYRQQHVPINIIPIEQHSGLTNSIMIVPWDEFWDSEIDHKGNFDNDDYDVFVEILLRGNLLIDCSGQPLDLDNRGSRPLILTGDGAPGGAFHSRFKVATRIEAKTAPAGKRSDR